MKERRLLKKLHNGDEKAFEKIIKYDGTGRCVLG